MKKVFKVAFVGLLSFVFWGCKTTEVWEIKEKGCGNARYLYGRAL